MRINKSLEENHIFSLEKNGNFKMDTKQLSYEKRFKQHVYVRI